LQKEGWELVRVGTPLKGVDWIVNADGQAAPCNFETTLMNWVIIHKIEKPKQYRQFANAAEYIANRREGFAVDRNRDGHPPGFYAVVSANYRFVWVAFGDTIERFSWSEAFEELKFRHADNATSPFGVEVQS
jgi:hypothetical protein